MDELAKIKRIIQKVHDHQPFETLLVIDSSMGRNAVRQTDIFAKEIGVSGIVITKLDGSAKGGVILEIADQFDVAIRFVGVGEGADDLSVFEPGQFARKFNPVRKQRIMLRYDNVTATNANGSENLKNVSLELPKSSLTVVTGGSGAGKSSLINVGAGLKKCHYGRVFIRNKDISHMNSKSYFSFLKTTAILKKNTKVN